MKGYKAFRKDLSCRGFRYEIGGSYEMEGSPILCSRGFHFCDSIAETYRYYPTDGFTRICEVETYGEIVSGFGNNNHKYCTNKIKIVREITEDWIRHANLYSTSTGYLNTGEYNSGNRNVGNRNAGWGNTGSYNSGSLNTGSYNEGCSNTGNSNTGDYNTGNVNEGRFNTGCCNSGSYNTGDWNTGNHSAGFFNTEIDPVIMMFNKPSGWTYSQWRNSEAYYIMSSCPMEMPSWINEKYMSEEEEVSHPEYKTTGGYLKTNIFHFVQNRQAWWNSLSDHAKNVIMSLPNFDADIFEQCTGIKVKK